MSEGRVRRAYIGLAGGPRPLPPHAHGRFGAVSGIEVVEVVEGSPAARAGLRPEDLVVEVAGMPTPGVGELQRLMVADLIGASVRIRVLRQGRELELQLVPAEL